MDGGIRMNETGFPMVSLVRMPAAPVRGNASAGHVRDRDRSKSRTSSHSPEARKMQKTQGMQVIDMQMKRMKKGYNENEGYKIRAIMLAGTISLHADGGRTEYQGYLPGFLSVQTSFRYSIHGPLILCGYSPWIAVDD